MKKLLESHKIPLVNTIGFASDNCATVTKSRSGFQAMLKEDVPSAFILGCVCHSFALCASHACSRLSSWLEILLLEEAVDKMAASTSLVSSQTIEKYFAV